MSENFFDKTANMVVKGVTGGRFEVRKSPLFQAYEDEDVQAGVKKSVYDFAPLVAIDDKNGRIITRWELVSCKK